MIGLSPLRTLRSLPRIVITLFFLVFACVLVTPRASAQEAAQEFRLEYDEDLDWVVSHTGAVRWASIWVLRWDSKLSLVMELSMEPVLRGTIELRENAEVALAWDSKRRVLHADLNGNGNLGDDEPVEVPQLESDSLARSECVLDLDGPHGRARLVLVPDVEPEGWSNARLVSGWTGEIEIDDRRWRISVFDDLDSRLSVAAEGDAMSLTPVVEEEVSTGPFLLPNRLGFGGGLHELTPRFEGEGNDRVVILELRPAEATLVPCDPHDEHLAMGIFEYTRTESNIIVVAHRPAGEFLLPAGSCETVLLWDVIGGGRPMPLSAGTLVSPESPLVLPYRGPVRRHLETRRRGVDLLEIEHQLLDADGKDIDRWIPFHHLLFLSVYRDREQIHTYFFERVYDRPFEVSARLHGADDLRSRGEEDYTYRHTWRVPLDVHGELRIVVGAGPKDELSEVNEGIVYCWPWYFHLVRLLPWTVLLLGLVWPRNRNLGAAMIALPVLLVSIPWWILEYGGVDMRPIEPLCLGPALALAAVGLLSPWLGTRTGRSRYLWAWIGALAVAAIPLGFFHDGERMYRRLVVPIVLLATTEILAVGAIARSKSTGRGFLGWYAGIFLVLTFATGILHRFALDRQAANGSLEVVVPVLLVAAMASGSGLLLSLPFLGLAVVSRTWRARFREILDGERPTA